jgi:hypothetical protein
MPNYMGHMNVLKVVTLQWHWGILQELHSDDCTADEFWTFLWNSKDFMMTCYTKTTATTEEENALGILSGHAYAILQIAAVVDNDGKNARILQVRNVL